VHPELWLVALITKNKNVRVAEWRITPWSRVVLEKLICTELVQSFHLFYVTRMFIALFTPAHQLSIFWAKKIQSKPRLFIF
jgi:hypothetical protein